MVGGIDYKHVGEVYNHNKYGCSNGCIYESVNGNTNVKYCFGPGKQISKCASYPFSMPVSHGKSFANKYTLGTWASKCI